MIWMLMFIEAIFYYCSIVKLIRDSNNICFVGVTSICIIMLTIFMSIIIYTGDIF